MYFLFHFLFFPASYMSETFIQQHNIYFALAHTSHYA